MGEEGYELLGVQVVFSASDVLDPIIQRFGDKQMLEEMEKVFFADGPNSLGHSYARLMHGPGDRRDFADVVDLLRAEPLTKRAVVTLCGNGNGKVPCLNAIQFLVRDGALTTIYFARAQDVYRKFYADGWCIEKMARRVAEALGVLMGPVTAFIGSSHVYDADLAAIREMLEQVEPEPMTVGAGVRL